MRDRVRLSLDGGSPRTSSRRWRWPIAASEIDTAILQTDRNVREVYEHAVRGETIPGRAAPVVTQRPGARHRAGAGGDRHPAKTAGGTSLSWGDPIERAWRDAHAGSVHVANDVDRALAMYGKGEFGLAVEDNLI
ncbi:hypothetical protein OG320_26795 [Microbispora sp. NBC_01189]|uniref:hypothetical protein n=1 Tax=Microbispora sp. NBC_01189 TaxID=2903583 RepID=UPI002E110D70|nr:hypothetical protein OG320_26795 [Microbispora sp. NBC_01189]